MASHTACPACRRPLQRGAAISAGGPVRCPHCGVLLPAPTAASPPPAAIPLGPAPPAGLGRARRVSWVVAGSLLFVTAGGGLAYWCIAGRGTPAPEKTESAARPTPEPAPPPKPRPKPPPFLAPQDQQRVDRAVRRGVAYLRRRQKPDGSWPSFNIITVGPTALAGLALLEGGVPADDPALRKAAAWLRPQLKTLNQNYSLSLAILFLDRLGQLGDDELIHEMALRLVAGQSSAGGWTYGSPVLSAVEHRQLSSVLTRNAPSSILDIKAVDLNKLSLEGEKELAAALKGLVVLQPPPGPEVKMLPIDGADNSNTQFAVLGLWAARRHGVPLDRTLALAVKRFRTSQQPDGSWTYHYQRPTRATLSFSGGGLVALAIDLGLTNEASPDKHRAATTDPDVRKALAWVGKQIGQPTGRWEKHALFDTLWLWSIERVAMLYNLRKIDGKEWYPWGAEILVANQQADGGWPGTWANEGHRDVSTSLALLFLARANLTRDITAKLALDE